jgi:uncharacterized protein YcgL (UPF0745 family)
MTESNAEINIIRISGNANYISALVRKEEKYYLFFAKTDKYSINITEEYLDIHGSFNIVLSRMLKERKASMEINFKESKDKALIHLFTLKSPADFETIDIILRSIL